MYLTPPQFSPGALQPIRLPRNCHSNRVNGERDSTSISSASLRNLRAVIMINDAGVCVCVVPRVRCRRSCLCTITAAAMYRRISLFREGLVKTTLAALEASEQGFRSFGVCPLVGHNSSSLFAVLSLPRRGGPPPSTRMPEKLKCKTSTWSG